MWTGRPEKTIYQYPRAKTFAERDACVRESMWAAAESIRMEKADRNARLVADYLRDHAKVAKVHYLAHHEEASSAGRLFASNAPERAPRSRLTLRAAKPPHLNS